MVAQGKKLTPLAFLCLFVTGVSEFSRIAAVGIAGVSFLVIGGVWAKEVLAPAKDLPTLPKVNPS